MADRAWQCLIKYAPELAHEATFHARSYGFRPGRSTHDTQKMMFLHLSSRKNGINKRILKLDIVKCFDRINHEAILNKVIAPNYLIKGLRRCLKAKVNPEFPHQGGVCSPLLANIALNGIEKIGGSQKGEKNLL
jgi:RNA-directed DNA polymerase